MANLRSWEYGDERIGGKETVFTITSLMIGVGILTLPRTVAKATSSSDGWVSILIAGGITLIMAWLVAKLSTRFRNRTFLEFVGDKAGKPVAIAVGLAFFLYFLSFTSYITRSVAELTKQYLFDRTPVEVVSLGFLLVVIYAVSGSRVGLVRLTMLFLPFVLLVTGIFLLMSVNLFEFKKLMPVLHSDWGSILSGVQESIFSFLGFEGVLFYVTLMRKPEEAPKLTFIGVMIAIVTYVSIYIFTIAVFSYEVTENIMYPTIELAREVTVPGDFFERLESLFLIFWLVSIFATTSIALDVSVQSVSYFTKLDKKKLLYVLAPILYLLSMYPQNIVQLSNLGKLVSYMGIVTALIIPVMLFLVVKLREVMARA